MYVLKWIALLWKTDFARMHELPRMAIAVACSFISATLLQVNSQTIGTSLPHEWSSTGPHCVNVVTVTGQVSWDVVQASHSILRLQKLDSSISRRRRKLIWFKYFSLQEECLLLPQQQELLNMTMATNIQPSRCRSCMGSSPLLNSLVSVIKQVQL